METFTNHLKQNSQTEYLSIYNMEGNITEC